MLEDFRADIRSKIERNCPPEMRTPMMSESEMCWGGRNPKFSSPAQQRWMEFAIEQKWTVPGWAQEYNGAGYDVEQCKILQEEMARVGARPPLSSLGIWMLGPALLKYGTEAQKRLYLPPIARGEIRWCQGYSEPGAGSDLAAVSTRAEDRGDHWIVNGQKIWTTYGDQADWMFCLVRTNPDAPKHLGISFVLFDMRTPGVTTRPIKLISGDSPFCETFFDDVRVPKENLVGDLDRGWDVAKYLLGHEREIISAMGIDESGPLGADLVEVCQDNPLLRAQIAHFDIRAAAFRACSELFLDEFKAGRSHSAQPSLMKYYGTELNKQRHELIMAGAGLGALEWEGEEPFQGAKARAWLRSKGNSIEGGTSEIQLNIISKRILALPTS